MGGGHFAGVHQLLCRRTYLGSSRRDEAEQKQDFEGATRDLKQSENDTQKDAAPQQPKKSDDDEE